MEEIKKDWREEDDSALIIETIFEYVRYWKWFIVSLAICLVIGCLVILTTQKEYKSSLSILLDEDKNAKGGRSQGVGIDLETLGLLNTTTNIDNEVAILSSPDLMRMVVDTLNLQSTYYTKGIFRRTEIYKTAPFRIHLNNPGKGGENLESVTMSLKKSDKGFAMEGTCFKKEGDDAVVEQEITAFPAKIALPDSLGILDITLTGQEIDPNEKYFADIYRASDKVKLLCQNLSIAPTSKTSSVLVLNLAVNNTERGATVLRELIDQYNKLNVKVNNEMAYNTAMFINDRLKEISEELGGVESELVDYKQKNRIADLMAESQLAVHQSGENKQKMMEANTQLGVINMVEDFVNNPGNKLKPIPNLGITDPTLGQAITEYNNKLLTSDALLKNTGEDSPSRQRVTDELSNLHKSISGSLKSVKQAYVISQKDLTRLSGSTLSQIQTIPQQEKGLLERVRQQQVKEQLFLFLMQKREETNISIASTSAKARIIASPQTELLPVAPKSSIILLAALVLGILIPIAIIYIINILRTQIRSRNQLEKLSEVSLIGQIGKAPEKDSIVVHSGQSSGISEMFRSLRNNLNFILKNTDNKIIQLTSTISGEGKSFVSVNLAMTYVFSGKRVLLVGADIRNPQLAHYFSISEKKGLTDYLVDSDPDWNKYIRNSRMDKNLDILIAGTIPPNPNELLMSPKLKTFLAEAKREYDMIIMDTAPVGLVSDTYLISENADVTLYVVRENVTPKDAINFINLQKKENRFNEVYLVLNGSKLDKSYKYGYGKGYGYEKKKK
jgi:capsular exopolysaccharide synthesis family protein